MLNLQGLLRFLDDFTKNGEKISEKIDKWRKVYYRMSLHIDGVCPRYYELRNGLKSYREPYNYHGEHYQEIFDYRLLNKYPTESELVRQWRLSQYKPFTKAPFRQVIQVLTGAIFQDSNYSITVADKDDDDYIWGPNFEGQNLPSYVSASFQDIANDPNAAFVVIPKQPWYATTSERIEPTLKFVNSKQIIHESEDEIIFDCDGYRWAVNTVGYFRFKYNETDKKWEEMDGGRGYYAHMLGYLPVFTTGGQWNSQGFYDSHLDAALAIADEYIGGKSSEQFVMKDASHPIRIEAQTDCPACSGNGSIRICGSCSEVESICACDSADQMRFNLLGCGACNGTGNVARNPGEILLAEPEQMTQSGQLVQYVNPDTAINKLHLENNKDVYKSLASALHLHYIEEAQSGTAKDKDMETRYQFILGISNDLFDRLITEFLKAILALRNVRVNNGSVTPAVTDFTIVKPTQFAIKTAQDLLDEYDTATKAGTPGFMRSQQLLDYQDKQFGGNDVLKRKTEFILQKDPMAVMSASEKSTQVMSGAFELKDIKLSGWLPTILDEIARDKGSEWFRKASYDQINAEVEIRFIKIAPPLPLIRDEEPAGM